MEAQSKEINIIVAMANNRAIGKNNQLLWHLPNDLQFFKRTTMGCPIIMGRKTYESIGRLLPGRQNVIISRSAEYQVEGATICHSLKEAVDTIGNDKIFVIGGGEIYKQTMHMASNLFITKVDTQIEGDTYFPEIEASQWKLTWAEEQTKDEKNNLAHTFQKYERVS